jgi:hypothetical protein
MRLFYNELYGKIFYEVKGGQKRGIFLFSDLFQAVPATIG